MTLQYHDVALAVECFSPLKTWLQNHQVPTPITHPTPPLVARDNWHWTDTRDNKSTYMGIIPFLQLLIDKAQPMALDSPVALVNTWDGVPWTFGKGVSHNWAVMLGELPELATIT